MYDRIAVASYHVILSFFATLLTFLVQLSMIDSLRIVRSWWNSKPIKSSGLPLTFPVFLSTYSNRNTCQLSFIFKLRRSLKKSSIAIRIRCNSFLFLPNTTMSSMYLISRSPFQNRGIQWGMSTIVFTSLKSHLPACCFLTL